MKKIASIICLVFLLSASLHAQGALRFGIRGGYDFKDQTINGDILKSSNRSGYHIGVTMDANVPILPFGVDASLLYTQLEGADNDNVSINKTYYLDVPVNLKYRIGLAGIGVVLSAGPYIRFNLDGGDIDLASMQDTYEAKTFQAGANFGVGIDLSKHFFIGVSYYTILTNNYDADPGDLNDVFDNKPDRMALTATYFF